MRAAAALALLVALTGCQQRAPLPERRGVVSIDFCADQMVLGLLPRERVRAVSFEAESDAGFAAPRARGLPRLRAQIEDIAALRPAIVVRSFRGDARLDRQLRSMGIRVVQLGYAGTLGDVAGDMRRVAAELDAEAKAKALLAGYDAELTAARGMAAPTQSALYVTPGDVTTGPGSFVANVIAAAGLKPYREQPGWGTLPLEEMVRRPPDVVFRAFYDSARYRQDRWSSSLHPVVAQASRRAKEIEVPGSWLACGNWLAGHAVARLAEARKEG